jgi:hypothetical protein
MAGRLDPTVAGGRPPAAAGKLTSGQRARRAIANRSRASERTRADYLCDLDGHFRVLLEVPLDEVDGDHVIAWTKDRVEAGLSGQDDPQPAWVRVVPVQRCNAAAPADGAAQHVHELGRALARLLGKLRSSLLCLLRSGDCRPSPG